MLQIKRRINGWVATIPLVISLLELFGGTNGQEMREIGVDICACQPSVYELTLDNSLTCADITVIGPGILDTACLIETRLGEDSKVTDFVFQTVSEIQILELDEFQEVIGQSQYTDGPYFDGDSVLYTSIVRSNPGIIEPSTMPRGFQVTVTGNNRLNQPIVNTWGILYDNDCGIFPLLEVGEVIGWTRFTDLGEPPLKFCPAAPPTKFPTVSPTSSPTESPSVPPPTSSPSIPRATAAPSSKVTATPSYIPWCPPVATSSPGKGNGSSRGSMSRKKKKSKKEYYYGSMMKVAMSSSSRSTKRNKSGKSGKSGKASQGSKGMPSTGKAGTGKTEKSMKETEKTSGKGGKGGKYDRDSSEEESTYSGRGYGEGERDLKTGPKPTAAPTECIERPEARNDNPGTMKGLRSSRKASGLHQK